MVFFVGAAGGTYPDSWTDFYLKNSKDGGSFQTLIETSLAALARTTEEHLNKVSKFTETITGSNF
jgi:hypothetical protein